MWIVYRSGWRSRFLGTTWRQSVVSKILCERYLCNESHRADKTGIGAEKVANDDAKRGTIVKSNYDEYDDYGDDYEPKTAKEKVWYYSTIAIRLGLLGAAVLCFGMFIKEVFPGRMGANSLFSETHEFLMVNDDVREITGTPMKAYGREVGRNEGRRNHVDSHFYVDVDGSKRTRVRFMLEGPRGKVRVWAEVSNKMLLNEFVYIICQDMQAGRVITIVDNRDKLEVDNAKFSNSSKNLSALLSK